jgi:hypothetical protein
VYGKYEEMVDRESAYEMLTEEGQGRDRPGRGQRQQLGQHPDGRRLRPPRRLRRDLRKSMMRSVASSIGNAIVKAVLGGRRR